MVDLDEVDTALLDIAAYVRRWGVSPRETERFLRERLETAFDVVDAYEDEINSIIWDSPGGDAAI